jgi:hypothetical protein
MQGLYFAFGVFAVAVVISWCRTADHGGVGEYYGLLAMRRPGPAVPRPSRKKRVRGRLRGAGSE